MRLSNFDALRHRYCLCILLALSVPFLMLGIGSLSLTHPDEVFYMQSAKEMLAHKSWLTPYLFDAPQFEKPIFSYWLLMLSIKTFGLTPFAGRFVPAVFGIIGVVATYAISWLLFRSKTLSFLAGLVLMSSVMYLAMSRAVLTDMIFTAWVTASIGAFYWGYRDPQYQNTGLILSGAFSGFALLTKGLLGFCFPAGTILVFLSLRNDLKFLKSWGSLKGLLVMFAIALPWYLYEYQQYGRGFIQEFFVNDHIRRLFEAEHAKSNTWYFYPVTVVAGLFPWTMFFIPAVGTLILKVREKGEHQTAFLFLLSWMSSVVMFVQPASSKLASYILPIFPAVVIVIAFYLAHVFSSFENNSSACHSFIRICRIQLVLMCCCPVIIWMAAQKYKAYVPDTFLVLVAICGFAILAGGLLWNLYKKSLYNVVLWIAAVPLGVFVICIFIIPYAEPWVSCKTMSSVLDRIDHSHTRILTSKFFTRGVRYYTDRSVAVMDIGGSDFFSPHPIPFLNSDDQVSNFLKTQPLTYGIVKQSTLRNLMRITTKEKMNMTTVTEGGGKFLILIRQ